MASVIDYRSVNLAWLIQFKVDVLNEKLASGVELLLAKENFRQKDDLNCFNFSAGATIFVESFDERTQTYVGTIPYGAVLKGEFPASIVERKARVDWTTEDVCEYVVKRICEKKQCAYLSVMNKKDLSKGKYEGTFVSQARRCRFADLIDALQNFFEMKQTDLSKQYIWLDIFCANQPKLTASKIDESVRKQNEKILTEGLHEAISHFDRCVMFIDKWDQPATLTRAWCIWEVFGVAKAKKQIEIALTEKEHDRYIATLKSNYNQIISSLSSLDAQKATCLSKEDLKMIQESIQRESSYKAVNDTVLSQLRLWVANTALAQVEKEERKENQNMGEVALLANLAGLTYQQQGQFVQAERLFRKALETLRKINESDENTSIATQLNNLGVLLRQMGRFDEAKPLHEEALRIRKLLFGEEHPAVAESLNSTATLFKYVGNFSDAEQLYRDALRIRKGILGSEHLDVAQSLNSLALLLRKMGKLDEAKQCFEEALQIRAKILGNEHPDVAQSLNNLARCLNELGSYSKAESLMREALRINKKVFGDIHPSVARDIHNLAELMRNTGSFDAAELLMKEALSIDTKVYGDDHPEVANDIHALAVLKLQSGDVKEAERLFRDALRIRKEKLGLKHPLVAQSLFSLAQLLLEEDKNSQEAARLANEASRISGNKP